MIWLIVIFFVFLSLFLSLFNMALRNISWVKLEDAFELRNQLGRLRYIREHHWRLSVSISLLRLLVHMGLLACVIYAMVAGVSEDTAALRLNLIKSLGIVLLLLCVFGVAIPNAWSKYIGMRLLVKFYTWVRVLSWFGWPMAGLLRMIDPVVRRLVGVPSDGQWRLEEQQEELLNVVEEHEKEGVVDEEEKEMIVSVLEFRDTTADEIMTPRTDIIGIEVNQPFGEVVEMMVKDGHSRYPVYQESIDNIVGLMYAKDLLRVINAPQENNDIRQWLKEPYFVAEDKTLRDLLHDFQDLKVHVAVVQDEYGGTAGIVTFEDVLEELVGEIVDEHEPPQRAPVIRVDGNIIEVDGRFEVDQLNDEYDLAIPESEDYETVGGFVIDVLGVIPKVNDTFTHGEMQFSILEAQERKVDRVRIVLLSDTKDIQAEEGQGDSGMGDK